MRTSHEWIVLANESTGWPASGHEGLPMLLFLKPSTESRAGEAHSRPKSIPGGHVFS
jgi:hypothetical protein